MAIYSYLCTRLLDGSRSIVLATDGNLARACMYRDFSAILCNFDLDEAQLASFCISTPVIYVWLDNGILRSCTKNVREN